MADRTCPDCSKVFKKPAYLRTHLQRKTPCQPIVDIKDLPEETRADPKLEKRRCHFCGRVLSSYVAKRRHIRQNCKLALAPKSDTTVSELLKPILRKQQAQIDDLKRQLADMEERIATTADSE